MEPEIATPETTAHRPCATCAAPMASGQDGCLECGSAQPGRLGARAGRRAALTVAAACALLATGAGAAAYAALSTEAEPVAAAPPPAAVAPAPAPPAATTPPPAEEETPVVEAPKSKPAPVPKPADDPEPAPAAPDPAPAPSGEDGGGDDAPAPEPEPIALDASSASTYDPEGRAGGGDRPRRAVDGRDGTAWEVPVADDGSVRVGLAVSLKQARALTRIAFGADTPGFTVEVYGTRAASLPPNVLDERWELIDTRSDVGVREEIDVKGKYRHVLLWVTEQPADTKVAVPEIQLFD